MSDTNEFTIQDDLREAIQKLIDASLAAAFANGGLATLIPAGAITTAMLANSAVTSVKLAAWAVTADEIAPSVISSYELIPNGVDADQSLTNGTVTLIKLAPEVIARLNPA